MLEWEICFVADLSGSGRRAFLYRTICCIEWVCSKCPNIHIDTRSLAPAKQERGLPCKYSGWGALDIESLSLIIIYTQLSQNKAFSKYQGIRHAPTPVSPVYYLVFRCCGSARAQNRGKQPAQARLTGFRPPLPSALCQLLRCVRERHLDQGGVP